MEFLGDSASLVVFGVLACSLEHCQMDLVWLHQMDHVVAEQVVYLVVDFVGGQTGLEEPVETKP